MKKIRWFILALSVFCLLFSCFVTCSFPTSNSPPTKLPSSSGDISTEPPEKSPSIQIPSKSSIPTAPMTPQQPKPQNTPTVTLEKGWKIHTDKDEGFEIALPDLWKALTREQIERSIGKSGLKLSGDVRYIFYAVDIFATAQAIAEDKPKVLEFVSSLSISKISTAQNVSLTELEEENVRDLERDPNVSQPIFHKRVELLAGEAVKLRYIIKLPTRAEPVVFIQYLLIKSNNVYYFTFETLPYMLERFEPNYDKIANSFRLMQ